MGATDLVWDQPSTTMSDRRSEELSASTARRRFRRAGWAMIGIGFIFPWFGYPLFTWLAGICAAALVLGVMILKRSYLATALGLLVPVLLLVVLCGCVLDMSRPTYWQLGFLVGAVVVSPITFLLLIDSESARQALQEAGITP